MPISEWSARCIGPCGCALSALAACRRRSVLIRKLGLDRAGRLGSVLMRSIGPRLRAHRVARANLKAAFPEKSDQEIERLLRGIWDNFGRVMAEYAFLDQLYNYDPSSPHKWIVI